MYKYLGILLRGNHWNIECEAAVHQKLGTADHPLNVRQIFPLNIHHQNTIHFWGLNIKWRHDSTNLV